MSQKLKQINGISLTRLYGLNLVTSCQYMVTYLCLNVALSYILSNSVFVFSLFTGIYLMSMGLGAFLANRINFKKENVDQIIIYNALIGMLVINPGVSLLMYFNESLFAHFRNSGTNYLPITFIIGIILTVLNGLFSGSELPLFSKLIEGEDTKQGNFLTRILTVDYLGTCLGVLVFSFVLFPFWGLINSMAFSQFATVLILGVVFAKFPRKTKTYWISYGLLFLISLTLLVFRVKFLTEINSLSF